MSGEPGRTALVTGASAGIGAEFASRLAGAGYDLVLVARRADRLRSLSESLAARHGSSVLVRVADLSEPGAPEALFQGLVEEGVHIDYLVNNAGIAGPDLLGDRDWREHRRFFELMMISVGQMCHLFIPPMIERGFGRVVNVSSVAGLGLVGSGAMYGPAKRYVIGLSEELNHMVGRHGVHVCALCPGFTRTEFHDAPRFAKLKADSPSVLWYDASVVVDEGMRAVEKGVPTYASGALYRWLEPLIRSRLYRWLRLRRARKAGSG